MCAFKVGVKNNGICELRSHLCRHSSVVVVVVVDTMASALLHNDYDENTVR